MNNKKQTILFVYAMTHDTGFAPCVQNKWLTLACCKGGIRGGMRKSAASRYLEGCNVYLLGLCGGKLAKTKEMEYRPVYFAKLDGVIPMTQYYADGGPAEGRNDNVYKVECGELKHRGNGLPHSDSEYTQKKDIGGQYVLCSRWFAYWGNKCGESGHEIETEYSYIFSNRNDGKKGLRDRRGFRGYIIEDQLTEFEEALKKWDWFPQEPGCCNIIGNRTINGDLLSRCGGQCR